MKKIFFTALVACTCGSMQAQFSYDYLRAADNYYKKGDYYSAAQYYEKWVEANKSKIIQASYNPYSGQLASKKNKAGSTSPEQVIYHLAESYRQLHYPAKALPYYQQALSFDKTQFPLAGFYYANTLKALQKYEEAEKAYQEFLNGYTEQDLNKEAAQREIASLKFVGTQIVRKDLQLYTINKAEELNSKGASYAPVMVGNTLLFTSTRPQGDKDASYINRVYEAVYQDKTLTGINKINLPQANGVHQGVISATPDGQTLFLTRWTITDGKKTSAIYTSKKTGEGWSEPVLVGGDINMPGSNSQQPFVTPDGKQLLYASNKPGGQGGFDLWSAELDASGQPVNSKNLGTVINTANDEQAPFYHAPSRTLVFSSNGRTGMGGYDFFYSKETAGNWAQPLNFGYPVNSVKDDIYFVSRSQTKNILDDVLLSSDRSSECCLDLFSMHKQMPLKEVTGNIVNCENQQVLAGINIQVIDPATNAVVATKTTSTDGRYIFTLEDFKPLKIVAKGDGYISNTLTIAVPQDEEAVGLANPALCLSPVPAPVVLENVYYDYNKSNLKPESYPSLDKLVALLQQNPTMVIELGAHTDNIGSESYNLKLSEARAKSVVAYLISKGIDASRLQAKGYGASQPLVSNTNEDGSDNPEGRQKNRRTEFKVLSK